MKLPDWYVYDVGPIDSWRGMLTVEEATRRITLSELRRGPDGEGPDPDENEGWMSLADWMEYLASALREIAKTSCWEGDVRDHCHFRVGHVIDDEWNEVHHFIALKQDNNGTTFVASPIRMASLDKYETRGRS